MMWVMADGHIRHDASHAREERQAKGLTHQ